VVAIIAIAAAGELKVIAGKRHIQLKGADITHYSSSRAKRGLALPRGFQRVDGLESE